MRLYEKTAYELSVMLRSRKCSAAEILNDVMERINSVENKIGAYVTINDHAEETARLVDEAIAKGESIHPLAGIPVGVKDNISTKGLRTTCCSRILENYVPPFDAYVIERLKKSGAVITGKTNMDEFAMGSSTENSCFHTTHNPYNTDYVPGGSSGGSAAAVAAGEAIAALGSDTGGSVRQPASFCGLVGMKPTYGRVSRYGLIAYASSLDQIGVMTKSVKDAAMLLSAISGGDAMDATSSFRAVPDYASRLSDKIKGLRIGIPEDYFDMDVDADIRNNIDIAIKTFEENGAVIRRICLPGMVHAANAYYIIASAEASSNLARYDGVKYGCRADKYEGLTDMYERTRSEYFGDEVKRRIMLGTFVLSSGYYEDFYKKAKLMQRKIYHEYSQAFEDCDIIATPVYPSGVFRIGENTDNRIKMYSSDMFTVPASLAGLPSISVPCGSDRRSMPVGMLLTGRSFDEQTVLDAAYSYEKICGGFDTMAALQQKGDRK